MSEQLKTIIRGLSAYAGRELEVQRVHDRNSVMSNQASTPVIVVRVAHVAEVEDCLVGARRIFTRDDVRFVARHGDHANWTQPVPPVAPEIRLVCHGVEATSGSHGDVTCLQTGRDSHVSELHVISRAAIAIDTAAEFLAARTCLHHSTADFALPDFPDA